MCIKCLYTFSIAAQALRSVGLYYQHTPLSHTQTKLKQQVFGLQMCEGLGEDVCSHFICGDVSNGNQSILYGMLNKMVLYVDVLRVGMVLIVFSN